MGLIAWLKGDRGPDRKRRAWRREWTRAVAAVDADAARRLRAALEAAPPLAEDVEVEEEMLEGLERLIALTAELGTGRLPHIETSHRVLRGDLCHYSAPASMPDDPGQPSGRLLLTSGRAVFVGGSKVASLPWHAAVQALQGDRDLLIARADGQTGYRFRCNTYGDALCAAALARHLMTRARRRIADSGSGTIRD
jgi:hypothetical protein